MMLIQNIYSFRNLIIIVFQKIYIYNIDYLYFAMNYMTELKVFKMAIKKPGHSNRLLTFTKLRTKSYQVGRLCCASHPSFPI